jgi:hypothetical protein
MQNQLVQTNISFEYFNFKRRDVYIGEIEFGLKAKVIWHKDFWGKCGSLLELQNPRLLGEQGRLVLRLQ